MAHGHTSLEKVYLVGTTHAHTQVELYSFDLNRSRFQAETKRLI